MEKEQKKPTSVVKLSDISDGNILEGLDSILEAQEIEQGEKQKEIERKFSITKEELAKLPLEQYKSKHIVQGYITIENGVEKRLRAKGGKYFYTVKKDIEGAEGKSRFEAETEIDQDLYDALWESTNGKRVIKTRYTIPYRGHTIELDVYEGENLEGLVTAEVEFPNEEASNKFVAPEWFSEELTKDKRYKNQNLALHGNPEK